MSEFDDIIERLDTLESRFKQGALPLDALPLRALQEKLEDVWNPEADKLLLPHSITATDVGVLPSAAIRNSATQAIGGGGGWKVVTLDTKVWDTDNMVSEVVGNRIRISTPGFYYLAWHIMWTGVPGGGIQANIQLNGGTLIAPLSDSTDNNPPRMTTSTVYRLNKGDYLEGLCHATNANTIDRANEESAYLRAHFLGATSSFEAAA